MNKGLWHFLVNQMDNCTRKNFKKALKLSRYHDAALLKAMNDNPLDSDYATAYNRYHILHEELEVAYSAWKSQGGTQKGATLNVKQLLKLMPAKVNKWWGSIINVYDETTPRFTAIFPEKRKPFASNVSKSLRIAAVNTLSLNIGSDVLLTAQRAETGLFYSQLKAADTAQTGDKTALSNTSIALEKARYNAMTGQYRNLGFFIDKMPETPLLIKPLFDVATITNPDQVIWKGHLDFKEIFDIMEHTFMAGDEMRLKCTGITLTDSITFYLASTPGGIDSSPVTVLLNHEQKIDVTLFAVADYNANRFLTVVNNSTGETRFMVQLY